MTEKRALQIAIAIAGLVPVIAGLWGALLLPHGLDLARTPAGETHAAYLSGLLLGIGMVYWSLIPTIERQSRIVLLLTLIVALGGLARLVAAARLGVWGPAVTVPLVMELGVTPALCLWQRRVSSLLGPE